MKRLFLVAAGALGLGFLIVSCTTTYDAQGRPVQTVDPGTALLGAAAAGVVGYSLGADDDDDGHYHRKKKKHYSHPHHRPKFRKHY